MVLRRFEQDGSENEVAGPMTADYANADERDGTSIAAEGRYKPEIPIPHRNFARSRSYL